VFGFCFGLEFGMAVQLMVNWCLLRGTPRIPNHRAPNHWATEVPKRQRSLAKLRNIGHNSAGVAGGGWPGKTGRRHLKTWDPYSFVCCCWWHFTDNHHFGKVCLTFLQPANKQVQGIGEILNKSANVAGNCEWFAHQNCIGFGFVTKWRHGSGVMSPLTAENDQRHDLCKRIMAWYTAEMCNYRYIRLLKFLIWCKDHNAADITDRKNDEPWYNWDV